MNNEEWLFHIAEDEAQLRRLRKELREAEKAEETSQSEEGEVRQSLNEDYKRAKREAGWEEIGMDVEDEDDYTAQDRADMVEGARQLEEHSEQVLTEFGLYKGKSEKIKESKGKSGKIREADVSHSARLTSVSYGKTKITEEGKDGDELVEIMPLVSIPRVLNEEGNAEKVQAWLIENDYGEVPIESLTEIGFA